ncbi:MAG: hypothetical protein E7004_04485 [Alphaproteobacteria bacterium]|nr:hypothetical protein [Alphaproteobacteria bacterium]
MNNILLARKQINEGVAFLQGNRVNGELTVYVKIYDENGRGLRSEPTPPIQGITLLECPDVPKRNLETKVVDTFTNKLRQIFCPKKVKKITTVLNQKEIDTAQEKYDEFCKKAWLLAKQQNSWLKYEV